MAKNETLEEIKNTFKQLEKTKIPANPRPIAYVDAMTPEFKEDIICVKKRFLRKDVRLLPADTDFDTRSTIVSVCDALYYADACTEKKDDV